MKRLIDRRAALGALASVPALALPTAVMSVSAGVRSGELDAWNRSDELLDEKHKLWRRITTTPAQTMAGMMAKLALAAPYFDADELEDVEETADGILASVAVDFKTLNPALATV